MKMSLCSLNMFAPPLLSGERTLRERNGKLENGINGFVIIDQEFIYPTISIDTNTIIKPSVVNENVRDVFIEKSISLWKMIVYECKHYGLISSLQLLITQEFDNSQWSQKISQKIAYFILFIWHLILSIYGHFFPYDLKSSDDLLNEFSKSIDWRNGVIRAFSWHERYHRCAVCLINDHIYIYSASNSFVPLLKHHLQRKVIDLLWHPHNEEILAVACPLNILIWTIDPNLKTLRIQNNCVRIIKDSLPSPLTSIAFDRNGDYLSVCGPKTSKIVLIKLNASDNEVKVIRRYGTGITKLLWSYDKHRLFAATTSDFIRVFENQGWSCDKWILESGGVCQSAVWSHPDGRILLLAPRDSTIVYAIAFYDPCEANCVGGSKVCREVLDVSEREMNNGVKVGGRIHDMVWDKFGERLSISFKDNPKHIALYATKLKPTLEICPIGFVHGLSDEIPLIISFHDAFVKGSLLTICWSSGFISYIPLEFDRKNSKSNFVNTPRSLTSFCVTNSLHDTSNTSNGSSLLLSPLASNSVTSHLVKLRTTDSVLSPRKPILFSRINHTQEGDDSDHA